MHGQGSHVRQRGVTVLREFLLGPPPLIRPPHTRLSPDGAGYDSGSLELSGE